MILFPILQLVAFIFLIPIAFTIPGLLILNRALPNRSIEKVVLATVVGFLLFTLVAYLTFLLAAGWLLFPLILLANVWFFLKHKLILSWPNFSRLKLALFGLILILGIILQLFVIAPSGWMSDHSLQFWSAHGHDSVWHVSLMNELPQGWPWENPTLAGERLVNYHFFSDLTPAWFNHYLHFDAFDLYFRLTPLLYSILFGLLLFLVGRTVGQTFSAGLWSMIFGYGCGSFGYLISWSRDQTLNGETIFGANQIQSSIGNPPQILSLIILLAFILILNHFLTKPNRWLFIAGLLLLGTAPVFKVYGGVVMLAALAIVAIWQLVVRRSFNTLALLGGGGLLGALLYLPNTANSQSFLIWQPWWFVRTMIIGGDRLDWLDHELRRQTYIAESNWKRVIQLELQAFLIFVIGNSGLRIIGFWQLIRHWKNFLTNPLWLYLLAVMIISFLIPTLFLQRGVAGNIIQFLQYYLIVLGIFAALTVANLLDRVKNRVVLIFLSTLIILVMIPTQIGLLIAFYQRPPFSQISVTEQNALNFLKTQTPTDSIILTPPYDKYFRVEQPTPPIWAWFDTAYVAALSNRHTYLSDTEQVDIMGYQFQDRKKLRQQLFDTIDPTEFNHLVSETNANYLYFPKLQPPKIDLTQTTLTKVYQNSEIEIWQINAL